MAYEPTEWKTGDVVTSEKLNKLENAVVDTGALVVHEEATGSGGAMALDKTWKEIHDALYSGKSILCEVILLGGSEVLGFYDLSTTILSENEVAYGVSFSDPSNGSKYYATDSENGYPTWTPSEPAH